MKKTVLQNEVDKFSKTANSWWQANGSYKVLHQFNKARVNFIKTEIINNGIEVPNTTNTALLDIACGGGLLSEPFAKLGFNVTGIDASANTIQVAKQHAKQSNLNINYMHLSLEDYISQNTQQYDVIFAMEIIEHVNNPKHFINMALSLLKPNGLLFLSTINKNLKALLLAKVTAEYILNWVPKNTHNFNKFVAPSTLQDYLQNASIKNIKGINYNLFKQQWYLSSNYSVNYIVSIAKNTGN